MMTSWMVDGIVTSRRSRASTNLLPCSRTIARSLSDWMNSSMAERKAWSLLYAEKWVTDESPERALKALGARYDVNGLGALLPIEPFG